MGGRLDAVNVIDPDVSVVVSIGFDHMEFLGRSLDEIGSIVVTQVNGAPVLVRDLGRTTLSHQEREGILGKDNNPDTIEGIVLMLKYQNPSETLRGLHAKVDQLNARLAGSGVRIVPGAMVLTRMPTAARSRAETRVSPMTPPLAEA